MLLCTMLSLSAIFVRCFVGKSVVNKRGEMVLTSPTPALPLYIWRDEDNRILTETYLSKYPGEVNTH